MFLIPKALARFVTKPFRGVGERIAYLYPGLKYDLKLIGSELEEGEYMVLSIMNALLWAIIVGLATFLLAYYKGMITDEDIQILSSSLDGLKTIMIQQRLLFIPSGASFILTLLFFLRYPRIQAGKIVEAVDRDLVYALKDLLLQINSGVSLYDAMFNISRTDYGRVSDEFRKVVQDITAGVGQEDALERMALRTESEFLRRSIWQMVTAMKAGASLKGALASILMSLRRYQRAKIRSYTQELNLWILLYVLIAVAIPSLGVTLLVILSTFSGIGLSEGFILMLVLGCLFVEMMLIEFVKVRRPVIRV